MLKTASAIIEDKNGPAAFARALGCNANKVRVWKCRNTIPRTAWPDVVRAFPDLTLDVLLGTERARGPQ
jgi:hypothetical protein